MDKEVTHPLDAALRAAMVAFDKELAAPSSSDLLFSPPRTDEHGYRTLTIRLDHSQPDGTGRVFEVTIRATESSDSRDQYWAKRLADIPEDRRVVIDHVHYMLGDGKGPSYGHGGRAFEIEFFDGRRLVTRDLWYQGMVPPAWREKYPDNARFVPQPPPRELADILRDLDLEEGSRGDNAE